MGYGIGLYGRYILWLHIGILTTAFRSTYMTEPIPDTCPEIEDIAQQIDTANMNFTFRYAMERYITAHTTDGNKTTCDRIYRRGNHQPFISVQMDKQIRVNYLRIIFDPYYASGWYVYSLLEINNFSCKFHCYEQSLYKRTSIFLCAGPPIKELIIRWHGFESLICEIQIFTGKKCTVLPQVENGSYIISSAANMSDFPFEVGTNATLQCSEGYEPSESQPITIECYANGQWSFSNVTCRKINCAVLPQVENGSYIIISSAANMTDYSFEIGTNAALQCSEGYEPSESQLTTIECYPNGQWSVLNVTCKEIPNIQQGSHQQYLIYVPIGISVLIIAVIALTLLNLKQISIYMRKPNQGQVMRERSDFKDEDDDDPLYESVTPMNSITRTTNDCNNTQPQNVFMLKPMETRRTSSRSRDCVSLYENIYARPDIIEHTTTNRNSSYEMSTVCNPVPSERSDSSEFVINDLYESFQK